MFYAKGKTTAISRGFSGGLGSPIRCSTGGATYSIIFKVDPKVDTARARDLVLLEHKNTSLIALEDGDDDRQSPLTIKVLLHIAALSCWVG